MDILETVKTTTSISYELQQRSKALNLKETMKSSRISSRHFSKGDAKLLPSLHLGKRFASKKRLTAHAKRAIKRQRSSFPVSDHQRSKSASSQHESTDDDQHSRSVTPRPLLACIGEPLLSGSEYNIHELPSESNDILMNDRSLHDSSLNAGQEADQNDIQVTGTC